MLEATKYVWLDGEFVRWEEAKIHTLTHTLHYGGGAFEGIRAYETSKGAAIFRIPEHVARLYYSASVIGLRLPYSSQDVADVIVELVRRNGMRQCYVRPLAYYGYGVMGVNPAKAPAHLSISCWSWGAYLPHPQVDMKVSKFIRIHPQSTVCDAKLCGHYVNSIQASLEIQRGKYHEALLLDYKGHVAEGPGENIFIVKNGVLYTPRPGTILLGITRATVLELARREGWQAIEADLSLEEVLDADEAFLTGTACEIVPVRSINDRLLGGGSIGPLTARLRELYSQAVHGELPGGEQWVTWA